MTSVDDREPGVIWEENPEDSDWIKTLSWDLPTDLPTLIQSLHPGPDLRGQKAALSKLMTLPAWDAAPDEVKAAAAAFLASRGASG